MTDTGHRQPTCASAEACSPLARSVQFGPFAKQRIARLEKAAPSGTRSLGSKTCASMLGRPRPGQVWTGVALPRSPSSGIHVAQLGDQGRTTVSGADACTLSRVQAGQRFDGFRSRFETVVGEALRLFVLSYQRFVSPLIGPHCRFYPTCSRYALTALAVHGPWHGSLLAVRRLLRCHPFHPGGVDLVPDSRGAGGTCCDGVASDIETANPSGACLSHGNKPTLTVRE